MSLQLTARVKICRRRARPEGAEQGQGQGVPATSKARQGRAEQGEQEGELQGATPRHDLSLLLTHIFHNLGPEANSFVLLALNCESQFVTHRVHMEFDYCFDSFPPGLYFI